MYQSQNLLMFGYIVRIIRILDQAENLNDKYSILVVIVLWSAPFYEISHASSNIYRYVIITAPFVTA